MKHTTLTTKILTRGISAECVRLIREIHLREFFLWLIFLTLLYLSGIALFSRFENPSETVFARPWQWYLFISSLCFSVSYFLFLLISSFFDRKWDMVYTDETLPSCTVLVPAYNEGRHVYDTIMSLLSSDYPVAKLNITAINDGSVDDTLQWLQKAQKNSGCVTVIDLKTNQGKKHALHLGMTRSASDVIVTVDSDSIVRKDTLRQIVQPFCDERVGAVAGSIAGKHSERNVHVRLLDVMLVFGCEFLRKAQSASGNVFCTPGALSAYRRTAVLPLIDQWLDQTFMGQPARIGEDRAIATLLLCSGHRIVHQARAKAETCLPDTYRGVCKMLIRWTRSDIRENIVMCSFVLKQMKKFSLRSVNLFVHWSALFINMLLPFVFLPVGIYCLVTGHNVFFQLAFIYASAAMWSLIPAVVYIRQKESLLETIWAFGFGLYSLLAISWISIYSLFTLHNSNWLTRELKKAKRS